MHKYDSFMTARNDFATKMVSKAGYVRRADVNLLNAIPSTHATLTSGDHDGKAVVLETTN
ncbi:hypothetical protein SDC9_176552 [bioreactor metagenome]|uniref:Uncharacterized protein n=1 Tax=bioreactor metagenome TaxID=1076179 RepID=A0A645GQB6_9ZZZZ